MWQYVSLESSLGYVDRAQGGSLRLGRSDAFDEPGKGNELISHRSSKCRRMEARSALRSDGAGDRFDRSGSVVDSDLHPVNRR